MFERIVVAVDGSEPAKHAVSVACDIAEKYGSEIHLVHTPQAETTAVIAVGAMAVPITASADEIEAAGRKVLEDAEGMLSDGACKATASIVGHKDPATDILGTVDKVDADLVIMGRRGLGSVAGMFLGSVSQSVSHNAKCACMTVC